MYKVPLTLHFEITDNCNNFCPHCYGSIWVHKIKKDKPSLLQIAQAIVNHEVGNIIITGGEPLLLGSKEISKLCRLFQDNNISFSLNTNGRLLTKEMCQDLAQYNFKSFLISLHSWDNDIHDDIVKCKNAATETKQGIMNAVSQGLSVSVNQVIDSRNIKGMYDSAKELAKLGVHSISLTRALSPMNAQYNVTEVSSKEYIDNLIKCQNELPIPINSLLPIPFCVDERIKNQKKKLTCSGGITSAVLSCYGDLRFCPHDTQIWGNILEEKMESIWERMTAWRRDVMTPEECRDCAFLADCRGGCRIAAKLSGNDYKAMDPWACHAVKNFTRKVIIDELDPQATYTLVPGTHIRKENDHFLIYSNTGHIVVNNDGYEFYKRLPTRFIPSLLLNENRKNFQTHYSFLQTLYQNGLFGKI